MKYNLVNISYFHGPDTAKDTYTLSHSMYLYYYVRYNIILIDVMRKPRSSEVRLATSWTYFFYYPLYSDLYEIRFKQNCPEAS